jgi:hypothetical protein
LRRPEALQRRAGNDKSSKEKHALRARIGEVTRFLGRVATIVIAAFGLCGATPADEASKIFAASAERTAPINSYTFKIHVDFALRSFPYAHFHVEGDGSFARPDLLSISFRHVPWFAKGFENVKLDPLEPQTWPQSYNIEALRRVGDHVEIEMQDRLKGHLSGIFASLDVDGLRHVEWRYLNGGRIAVDVTPLHVDGYPLPSSEDADVQVPGYHVVAHATFTDYQLQTVKGDDRGGA